MAIKNQALTVQYQAWDTVANAAKTADVANHAIRGSGDGTIFTPAASPAEVDATNFPGLYKIALTAGEMNYNFLSIGGKSSTTGIVIVPVHITTERAALYGLALPGANGGLPTVDAANKVNAKVAAGDGADAATMVSNYMRRTDTVSVGDKTGFALATSEHTAISVDVAAALNTAVPGSPTANSIFARIDNNIGSRMATFTYTAPDNGSITAILAAIEGMPVGLAGTVQDTGATTALVKTSGLPTSGTYPAAGATLQIIFTSGALAGRDFVATYTPGAAGTQRLAFSPVLPSAPANGVTFVALEIPG
jgi:hypothetical protein